MLVNIFKLVFILIFLIGSVPLSLEHPCSLDNNETTAISQSKMPCHTEKDNQIKIGCGCLNCFCLDYCSNSLVYSFAVDYALSLYGVRQNLLLSTNHIDIPSKPLSPLLRPPIIS